MAELHQFTYGWIIPGFSYALAFLGALVGLGCAARARASHGRLRRVVLLALGVWSLGGIALWSMHFVAMIGFTVGGDTAIRYDPVPAALGLVLSVAAVAVGIALIGFGRPGLARVLLAGVTLGAGLAVAHYADAGAMRLGGDVGLDPAAVAVSFAVAVVVATTALWWAVRIGGRLGAGTGAAVLAVAACCAHYLGMAALRVNLHPQAAGAPEPAGLSVNLYLAPVVVFVTTVVVALMYLVMAGPGRVRATVRPVPVEPAPSYGAGMSTLLR